MGEEFLRELERAVALRDSQKIFELSSETLRRSDPMKFVDELLSYLRDRIVEVGVRSPEFPLLSDFFESVSAAYPRARMSPDPMFVIETTIAKVAFGPVARIAYDVAEVQSPSIKVSVGPRFSRAARAETGDGVSVKSEDRTSPTEIAAPPPETIEIPPVSEPPSVSVAELVSKLRETPRSAALVQALKNAPKSAFSDVSTFLVSAKNSFDSSVLSKPESRTLISECLQSLCGRPVSVKVETAS